MKRYFNHKLICLYIVGLILFSIGTIKYFGNPYTRYQVNVLMAQSTKYAKITEIDLKLSKCYACIGDDANSLFYSDEAVRNYHIADSCLKQAQLKRLTIR